MIPAGKPPISLIALKFSTLFRQLQHHLWKSGETLECSMMGALHHWLHHFLNCISLSTLLHTFSKTYPSKAYRR